MKLLATFLLLALTTAALGDALILDDGTRLEGKVHKEGDQWLVVDSTGKETAVDADRIQAFELGDSASADSPAQRLASLRRSAENLSDLHLIIDRYNSFIKASASGDAVDQANADLALWQQRLDQQCIKVGKRWLTPAQRQDLDAAETISAQHIGDLIRAHHMDEAISALKQSLTDDPQNPTALYLRGLVLADQNQNLPASDDFKQVAKLVPDHAPTLNNLAVILCRQHLYPAALKDYVRAMTLSPVNQTILDNVAEALNALAPQDRDNSPAKQAAAIFTDQDKLLQKQQEAKGLYRWGATWVTAKQLPRLTAEESDLEIKLSDLQSEISRTQSALAEDDSQIRATQQLLQAMSSPISVGNAGIGAPNVPWDYYQLQQDLALYYQERDMSSKHLAELQSKAPEIMRRLSLPKFTGRLLLFGPEGAPIRAAPTTQPAPQP